MAERLREVYKARAAKGGEAIDKSPMLHQHPRGHLQCPRGCLVRKGFLR